MKLGTGNKSLPQRAAEDVARAMEKAVQSLADIHGVDLNEVARENDAAADAAAAAAAAAGNPPVPPAGNNINVRTHCARARTTSKYTHSRTFV